VANVAVLSANGLAGTTAIVSSAANLTLSTTVTGLLKGNGTAISAAVAGTDYVVPSVCRLRRPGRLRFGTTGSVITGNSSLTWNDTGKNFAVTGYTGAAAAFSVTGSVPATPPVDAFLMSIANPNNGQGNIFRLRSGAAGTTDQFKVDMFGDGAFSGSVQAFALNAPPAGSGNAFRDLSGQLHGRQYRIVFRDWCAHALDIRPVRLALHGSGDARHPLLQQ
jgi:hypothetical protein